MSDDKDAKPKNPKKQAVGRHRGRKKGVPNRKTKLIEEILAQEVPGFNPIVAQAKIAHLGVIERFDTRRKKMVAQPIADDLRVKCLCEVSQYLYPKRKALEHSGQIDGQGGVLLVENVKNADDWLNKK